MTNDVSTERANLLEEGKLSSGMRYVCGPANTGHRLSVLYRTADKQIVPVTYEEHKWATELRTKIEVAALLKFNRPVDLNTSVYISGDIPADKKQSSAVGLVWVFARNLNQTISLVEGPCQFTRDGGTIVIKDAVVPKDNLVAEIIRHINRATLGLSPANKTPLRTAWVTTQDSADTLFIRRDDEPLTYFLSSEKQGWCISRISPDGQCHSAQPEIEHARTILDLIQSYFERDDWMLNRSGPFQVNVGWNNAGIWLCIEDLHSSTYLLPRKSETDLHARVRAYIESEKF